MTLPVFGNSLTEQQIATEFSSGTVYPLASYYAGGSYVPSGTNGFPSGGGATAIPSSGLISFNNFFGSAKGPKYSGVIGTNFTYLTGFSALFVGNIIYGFSSNGSRSVAVGSTGYIFYSLDNFNWTQVALDQTGTFYAVVWNGSKFCAAGASNCATSPDGITWTYQASFGTVTSGNPKQALIWTGSLFCAIGAQQPVTSPDGITWTLRSAPPTSQQVTSVVKFGTSYVAVGVGRIVYTSSDCITWTNQLGLSTSSWTSGAANGVAWNGSVMVAIGGSGISATSPNGITWTVRASSQAVFGGGDAFGIVWTGSLFIAVGNLGAVITSPDGITWTAKTGLSSTTWGTKTGSSIYGNSTWCLIGGRAAATTPFLV